MSSVGWDASTAATRSSAFWSTTTRRKAGVRLRRERAESPPGRRCGGRRSRRRGRNGGCAAAATERRLTHPPWPPRSCRSCSPLATPRRRSARPCGRARADLPRPRARRRRRRVGDATADGSTPSATRGSASSATTRRSARGALNVGLDEARAYVARMDADDVRLPGWLERVFARIRFAPPVAIVGTGMIDLHGRRIARKIHRLPGPRAVAGRRSSRHRSSTRR